MVHQRAVAKPSGLRFRFINETIAELKKVVWLSRREVIYLTALVLIICLMVAIVLGVIDWVFTRLINNVFLGG